MTTMSLPIISYTSKTCTQHSNSAAHQAEENYDVVFSWGQKRKQKLLLLHNVVAATFAADSDDNNKGEYNVRTVRIRRINKKNRTKEKCVFIGTSRRRRSIIFEQGVATTFTKNGFMACKLVI